MTNLSKNARIVGFIYLLGVFMAPLRLIYIPTKLFVHGDADATAANIAAHQTLFQLGIFTEVYGAVLGIILVLAFYRLFKDVNQFLAVLLVITGGILPAAVDLLNSANDAGALLLVRSADYLKVFDDHQRNALAMVFLKLYDKTTIADEVLWGLWLFPMAILILKSRWFPRFLGCWLILNGFSYLLLSYLGMFMPEYVGTVSNYAFPLQLGEVAFVLWALILGAKERSAAARATA